MDTVETKDEVKKPEEAKVVAPKKEESKPVEPKKEEKKVEVKAEEPKKEEKKPEAKPAETKKVEPKKDDKKSSAAENIKYFEFPVRIHRGPSEDTEVQPYVGNVVILEAIDNFTKVDYVMPGVGTATGYILTSDLK